MALRIGVDAWNLPFDRRGIGRYVREIVRAWVGLGRQRVQPVLVVPEALAVFVRGRYLRELGCDLPVVSRGKEGRLDAVWFPWNGMSWISSVPAVATLHDASLFCIPPEDLVVAEREQRPFRVAAERARRIITDSEFSKAELVRHLELDPSSVDVIRLGVSDVFARLERGEKTDGPRYLLFVGEIEARKGFGTLLEALDLLPEGMRGGLELVVAGVRSKQRVSEDGPAGVVIRSVGWVSDDALARLYRDALALVYPSRYEGYGLPIVEAMAAGAPVIAADTPSSREAGGAAATYVTPGDAPELAHAIAKLAVAPDEVLAAIRETGFEYARTMTWSATALETLAVFERVFG